MTEKWLAVVTYYNDLDGKSHEKTKHYPIRYTPYRRGRRRTIPLDKTKVIRDLVPPGCETTSVKITREEA